MKFVLVCCVFMAVIFNDVQAQVGTIVAADQNAQSRASDQGPLLIQGIVAAEQNARSGASDQGGLIVGGVLAAEQNAQNQAGQNKLQLVVQS